MSLFDGVLKPSYNPMQEYVGDVSPRFVPANAQAVGAYRGESFEFLADSSVDFVEDLRCYADRARAVMESLQRECPKRVPDLGALLDALQQVRRAQIAADAALEHLRKALPGVPR